MGPAMHNRSSLSDADNDHAALELVHRRGLKHADGYATLILVQRIQARALFVTLLRPFCYSPVPSLFVALLCFSPVILLCHAPSLFVSFVFAFALISDLADLLTCCVDAAPSIKLRIACQMHCCDRQTAVVTDRQLL